MSGVVVQVQAGFPGWAARIFRRARGRDLATARDGELLDKAAAGDESACRELLRRHGPRLCSVIDATHRDPGLAEDVVQETFLRAIQRSEQLREGTRLFPWLVRIALRVAIDHRRKTRREAAWDDAWDAPSRLEDGPDHEAERRQNAALVERAIAELDEYPRRLVALRYFAQLSTAELAEVFDKSEAAIRKDLQRARGQLKVTLQPWLEAGPR